ncbi:MAG: dihydropyrimidinase [Tissierellales bacterium]|jgi:dihydropyrimidinase|nr:dihydropyrimidinase [Tissierellales bacterium]
MATIIKNGRIITATDDYMADIKISEGKVVEIGKNLEASGDELVDAKGCLVVPGSIDPHTHFDLDAGDTNSADDFETGSKAALMGGTTTIIDFATQFRGQTLHEGLEHWNKKAQNKSYCDYGFHMAIAEWNDTTKHEMKEMVELGIPSFKLYTAYKATMQLGDGEIYQALACSRDIGALIEFHCENGDVIEERIKKHLEAGETGYKYHPKARPIAVEAEATERVIRLAELAEAPVYIVHISCGEALEAVREARKRGVKVYAETCPQYLFLDESVYDLEDFEGAKYVISPPLRNKAEQEKLWNGLENGDLEIVASDHCPFNLKGQKDAGKDDFSKIPNGAAGVEHRFNLLYTYGVEAGRISLNQWINLTSTRSAKVHGMFPQKGTIAIGSDADIVVFDPNASWKISVDNHHQNVDYTPYEGFEQTGKVRDVFLRGRSVVRNGEWKEAEPAGEFVKRKIR